jgi:hypothetical protein
MKKKKNGNRMPNIAHCTLPENKEKSKKAKKQKKKKKN